MKKQETVNVQYFLFFQTSKQAFEYLKRSPEGIRGQSSGHTHRSRERIKEKRSNASLSLHVNRRSFGLRSGCVMGWGMGMTLEEVRAGNERSDGAGQRQRSGVSIRKIANHREQLGL